MTVSSSEAKTHQTSEQPKAKGEAAAKEIEEKVNKGKAEEVTVGEPQNGEVSDADIDTIEAELAAGSRAFAFKNYAIATECFSKACEKLTTHHPENYSAIIDAHLSYGKALLRNAINLGSLSGGLNAHNPTATEPEDATPEVNGDAPSSSKVGPAEASTASTSKPPKPDTSKGIKGNPQIHFSGDDSDEDEDAGGEEDEEIDQAEEPVTVEDELENAFQVLDFARQSILTQIDSSKDQPEHVKKLQTKLIDVYDLIAQVHQEGEQFEQAVESYKSSLEVKKSRTDAPAGTIAETHLMIALALELIPDEGESMKQAIGHIDEAIDLMKSQLDKLTHQQSVSQTGQEGQEKPAESVEGDKEKPEAAEKLKSEIEETQSLIGELEAKREELKTVPQAPAMTEADKALQAYLAAVNSNPSTTNGKAAINDLTSLVKKRARPVESSSDPQANNASASSSGLPPTTNSNLAAETPSKKLKTSNQTTDV
ncbi:hypothetical protein PSTG_03264 [Puccinia striiformis f. sp. tritici PST-78]|uniref:Tetratricopeptide SHNi-TPR domain-containing protein n=1 Tax=Puccinia striiformis f. sp. tritici PST-78 TaxID=1165861 RepID=A0A0L0VX21_9BASI|nr:hypothetical protein PSTG_03264 [Puccinia striiformis f. sp. tritici PST-78]